MVTHSKDIVIDVDRLNKTDIFGLSIRWGDLTKAIGKVVLHSRVVQGMVLVQSYHTTTMLLLNENEPGLLQTDVARTLRRLFPATTRYAHDNEDRLSEIRRTTNADEHANGDRHCMAMLAGQPSLSLAIRGSSTVLGEWQSILFFDLDAEGRHTRRIMVHVQGDGWLFAGFARLKHALFRHWEKRSYARACEDLETVRFCE